MTGEQVFVSHDPADLELVQQLFSTVRNFPFGVRIALEEVESNRNRDRLEGRLANSDVVVAVLTEESATSRWLNQEIGYATGAGSPVLPLFESADLRGGFVADTDGVRIDRDDPAATVFNVLRFLRSELAPLGGLSVPNWYVRFECTVAGCGHPVTLDLEADQAKLWRFHQHGQLLETTCDVCDTTYYFDPATVGFVRREDRTG